MTRRYAACVGALCLCLCLCACEVVETSTAEQPGLNIQGLNIQGLNIQGMSMLGFQLDGATLAGAPLANVRVEQGEVVAEQGGATLRGASLVGAHLQAQVRDLNVSPPATALVEYRISAIEEESPAYDPLGTGATFLYTLEQWVSDTGSWQPACPADADGRRVAIPVAAIWDERGDRIESSTLFTFGCTTGVLAKCYRWGYRPWVTGHGDLVSAHWTCTRMARADYCGNGVPFTQEGTTINVWDNLSPPIQPYEPQPFSLLNPWVFEAGWNTGGAVCLSTARWLTSIGALLAAVCPDRLILLGLGARICDTVPAVLDHDATAMMFNQKRLLNLGL